MGRVAQSSPAVTFWHWYCCHCGWSTKDEPVWAWADAAAIHHRKTEHPADEWRPYETSVSAFGGTPDFTPER